MARLTFTTSGSWTVPDGVTSITVEAWGGGGGGGGTTVSGNGGGGGGGAYAKSVLTVIVGTAYSFTVGSGGAGGTGNGVSGAATNFNAGQVFAPGGTGGGAAPNGSSGSGGNAASGAGDTRASGGAGGAGGTGIAGGGGGGESGGPSGLGHAGATSVSTAGGAGGTGNDNAGDGGNGGIAFDSPGSVGLAPGGGGGGATSDSSSISQHGGNGSRGLLVITYDNPQPLLKSHLYKVYRNGAFQGLLPNVTSDFGFSQDINTAGSQITVTAAVSPDTSALPVSTLDDEDGNPLQTEDGFDLTIEGVEPIVSLGGGDGLIANGNKLQVWEYSQYHPNGICMFLGEIENWQASFGGDNQDEQINILVYSDGQDLANDIATGNPYDEDQVVESGDGSSGNITFLINNLTFGSGFFDAVGQTITTGAAVTNIARVVFSFIVGDGDLLITTLWPDVATANASTDGVTGSLGTVRTVINLPLGGQKAIDFVTPIPVSSSTSYFLTFSAGVGSQMATPGITPGTYSGGDVYTKDSFSGGWGLYESLSGNASMYIQTYSSLGETATEFDSEDITDMFKSIMNNYGARGGAITYTDDSVDETGSVLSYIFNTALVSDSINTLLTLAPDGFYWYVDIGTNIIYFKQSSTTPDLWITKGKEINSLTLVATIENIKNVDYEIGGAVGGSNLFSIYTDATSLSQFGRRLNIHTDNRVTVQSTQDAIGESYISENKSEQFQTSVTLLDGQIDITTLKPGQIVGFRGFGTFVDRLTLQIMRINYTPEQATLTLGALPPRVNITLAQITRNLLAQETINNPSAPGN